MPHSSSDTAAAWSKSGYHGWWYGWQLHLAVVVGSVWLPLAAECTIASDADNVIAPKLLEPLPLAVRYVLGDTHDNTPELRDECARHNRELVTTRRGPYPHRDGGVEVRRLLHKLQSLAIEPVNGVFKTTFEWHGQMPVKGLQRCQLFALGAILLYQIVLLYQQTLSDLTRVEQTPHIECREWMTATHAQMMQATGNLHDHIRHTIGGQTEDIFDNPTPFHTGNHVFDDDADTGDQMIEELVPNAQLLATGLFLGCWVRTPAGS